jgi:hypothetical protein
MQKTRRGHPLALITGALLGLLVGLLFMVGSAAQEAGSAAQPTPPDDGGQGTAFEGTAAAGIIITPTTLTITEPSGWATFTIALNSQPDFFVLLPVGESSDECWIDEDQVYWTPTDWQRVFTIRVTAEDDDLLDGDQTCIINTGPATSIDPDYTGFDPPDVDVIVQDDEYLGWVYLPAIVRSWSLRTEIEPNDTPAQANVLVASDVIYRGTFPDPSDTKDYFYIELAVARTVEGWLTNIPAGENYDLVLRYDFEPYDPVPGGYSGELGNSDEQILTSILTPGRYLIQIFNRAEGAGSTDPYQLRVIYE